MTELEIAQLKRVSTFRVVVWVSFGRGKVCCGYRVHVVYQLACT